MKVPNKFTQMFPEYPVNQDGHPDITGMPLREWSKRVFTDYVEYFIGPKGWQERGASSPAHVVDCMFACIQVALLGGASDPTDADSKRSEMDRMLVYK
jgi:hypothetical protein